MPDDASTDLLPAELRLNAWTGDADGHGALATHANRWGSKQGLPEPQQVLLEEPPDPTNWADPKVGYGIVVPDSHALAKDKAIGADLPEPIRDLLGARPSSVLLRARDDQRFLTRYFPDGTSQAPKVGLSPFGTAKGHLPRYLAIVGGPDEISWQHQFVANVRHVVGRIPLSGEALGNYVAALIDGWAGDDLDVRGPVVWEVNHGGNDITSLMASTFATPLCEELKDPRLPSLRVIGGPDATATALTDAIVAARPALIVTSSHGRTGPLNHASEMAGSLGLPVDVGSETVTLDSLSGAIPKGAIWYAQACCSAGGGGGTKYDGLLTVGSDAERIVSKVGQLPLTVSPAALTLLSRPDPVRAVIGHVEPTFDWTLSVPETGQGLGAELVNALAGKAHAGWPIGLGFDAYYHGVGQLHAEYAQAAAANDPALRNRMTRLRLCAIDRQSLVLLGDPTVALPNVFDD